MGITWVYTHVCYSISKFWSACNFPKKYIWILCDQSIELVLRSLDFSEQSIVRTLPVQYHSSAQNRIKKDLDKTYKTLSWVFRITQVSNAGIRDLHPTPHVAWLNWNYERLGSATFITWTSRQEGRKKDRDGDRTPTQCLKGTVAQWSRIVENRPKP